MKNLTEQISFKNDLIIFFMMGGLNDNKIKFFDELTTKYRFN